MKIREHCIARFLVLLVALPSTMTASTGCQEKAPEAASGPDQGDDQRDDQREDQRDQRGDTGAPATPVAAPVAADAPKGPTIVYPEGPKPADDAVIARAGKIEVTLADFARSVTLGRLFAPTGADEAAEGDGLAPEVPAERLALPHLHVTMSQALLNRKVIDADLDARGIRIEQEAIAQFLRDDPTLSRWGKDWGSPRLEARLARLGLIPDDLAEVARQQLQRRHLEDALLATITDEELWERYRMEHETVTLLLATIANTPTREEITEIAEGDAPAVEAYFEEHKGDFAHPPRLIIDVIRSKGNDPVEPATLAKAAERMAAGDEPAQVGAELGLIVERGRPLARAENPKAFGGDVGSTGFVTEGPRGAYAWRVVERRAGGVPELNRPQRREVAAEMLRKQGLTSTAKQKLARASKLLRAWDGRDRAALEAKLREQGLVVHVTEAMPRSPNGYIPGVGLAEEVLGQAFELTSKRPVSPEPVLSRQVGYVARLLARDVARREDFDAQKEALRPRYLEEARATIVERYIGGVVAQLGGMHIDVEPLRRRYGVLQKGH